jgi:hypothetical protein
MWLMRFVHPPLFLFVFTHLLQTHSPLFDTLYGGITEVKVEQALLFAFEDDIVGPTVK